MRPKAHCRQSFASCTPWPGRSALYRDNRRWGALAIHCKSLTWQFLPFPGLHSSRVAGHSLRHSSMPSAAQNFWVLAALHRSDAKYSQGPPGLPCPQSMSDSSSAIPRMYSTWHSLADSAICRPRERRIWLISEPLRNIFGVKLTTSL